jgi:hypothetical protein
VFEGFEPEDNRFAWLIDHASGWQFGEQGILIALADKIDPNGQCVEIGAGDGDLLPLTIDPFYERGNECLLFEADAVSLGKLVVKYLKATHRGKFAEGFESDVCNCPAVCVIDVDGIDSQIMWTVLGKCNPHVLMVEHFDKCHPADCDTASSIPDWLLGQPLALNFKIQDNAATINLIASDNEYIRVGTTRVNSIFVHKCHLNRVSQ